MKRTKRFFVDELHKNDNTLSKTKLFKMKVVDLENMFNNLNLTASSSDTYSRAAFDDISDEEKEPEEVAQEPAPQAAPEPIQEVQEHTPKPEVPKPTPQPKFNRREIKKLFLDPFNKEITDLIKDLDDGNINEALGMNEFSALYEEYLTDVEEYTREMEMSEKDIQYIDNFFSLQEKRVFQ